MHVILEHLQCQYQSINRSSLREHKESKHEGVKYLCNKCNKQFNARSTLRYHIESNHTENKSGGAKYSCKECDKQFKRKDRLREHKEIKHEGTKPLCNNCKKQFSSRSGLRLHVMKQICQEIKFKMKIQK